MQININKFLKLCKRLKLKNYIGKLSEPVEYEKSNKLIYWFIFLMSAIGKQSMLQMDQEGRVEKWKKVFRINRFKNRRLRNCVVSDTTIEERIKGIEVEEEREITYGIVNEGIKADYIKRTCIVDGSVVNGNYFSFMGFVTGYGDCFYVDVERYEKRGKELSASKELIKRAVEYVEGVIEWLLLDGLYFNEGTYKLRQSGKVKEILIKYTPKKDESGKLKEWNRKIIKEFEKILFLAEKPIRSLKEENIVFLSEYRFIEGEDKGRGVKYKIWSVKNLSCDRRFKTIKVYEKDLKDGSETIFYVFCTDKTMSEEDMRELGHNRWIIENNGFKMLNSLLKTKRKWSEDWEVMERLLLIFFVGFNMLWLFRRVYRELIEKVYYGIKITTPFISRLLEKNPTYGIVLDTS